MQLLKTVNLFSDLNRSSVYLISLLLSRLPQILTPLSLESWRESAATLVLHLD